MDPVFSHSPWGEGAGAHYSPGGGGERGQGHTIARVGGGEGESHTLPIRVCAAQRGRDFEAPDLERGIHFRGVF